MAAGQGFKTFTTGEVLTAGDVNGYLMQGINVFATTTARNAAITSPAEGQFAFTKDTNSLWYYDGAAWVASGATGDIEGVTAGVGISGGGTSGTVTITNSMATAITTAGDLIKGTGSGTFDRLGIGSTGQVLTVSGGAPVWSAPAGGGKILQVVQGTTTTETTIASTTMTDTTITATITPTLSTSKVLILIAYSAGMYEGAGGAFSVGGRIMRGATSVYDRASGGVGYVDHTPSNPSYKIYGGVGISGAMVYQDSPATTSATTYKLQSNISATAGGGRAVTYQGNNVVGSIILMEVGA